jgi:hypothetical protein
MAQGGHNGTVTRSKDDVWLVGHPCNQMTSARIPSGRRIASIASSYRIVAV